MNKGKVEQLTEMDVLLFFFSGLLICLSSFFASYFYINRKYFQAKHEKKNTNYDLADKFYYYEE